jgi:hypothetical protein
MGDTIPLTLEGQRDQREDHFGECPKTIGGTDDQASDTKARRARSKFAPLMLPILAWLLGYGAACMRIKS